MTGSARRREIDRFLARTGWNGAAVEPLAADASFRRYLRIRRGPETAVLMDAPPDREPIEPYAAIARHLLSLGFAAPRIDAEDRTAGLLLMEDLGDDTFTRLLARGEDEAALYELAVDTLIALHRLPAATAVPPGLPAYSDDLLMAEADYFLDWYLPAIGRAVRPGSRSAYGARWREAFARARDVPQTLVLRDFHVDNLMRLDGREGPAACGLSTFRTRWRGRRATTSFPWSRTRGGTCRPRSPARSGIVTSPPFPISTPTSFDRSCAVLGAQRHCKVIGIFTRLSRRDGKDAYLGHIARVWRLLEAAVRHPALQPIRDWLDETVPPAARAVPGPRAAA